MNTAAVNEERKKPNRIKWRILLAMLLTSPIVYIFHHFGDENRGWAAWVFVMTIGLILAAHWKWRKHVMFWIAVFVLVVLHGALLVRLPWNSWNLHGRWPSLLALVDAACNLAIMQLILLPAKLPGRTPTSKEDSTRARSI